MSGAVKDYMVPSLGGLAQGKSLLLFGSKS